MRRHVRTFFGIFAVATGVALLVRLFLIEDYRIASDSMYPNLWTGDLVFVSKYDFNVRFPFSSFELATIRRPKRGEVVAFTLPDRGLETFVKRVVALDGDTVQIRNGVVSVNEKASAYETGPNGATVEKLADGASYAIKPDASKDKDYGPVIVPKDHFFVLGDNRKDSVDSRAWGPVPYSSLKGRVAVVWMSLDADGTLRKGRAGTWIHAGLIQQNVLK